MDCPLNPGVFDNRPIGAVADGLKVARNLPEMRLPDMAVGCDRFGEP